MANRMEMDYMSLLSDLESLRKENSVDAKQQITEKISHYFNCGIFDDGEAKIAEEVLRLLARDAEKCVQRTLAEELKQNPRIPHDVALTLAKSTADIATPILEFSKVLTDEDLIEIVRSTKEALCLVAIAKRKEVSEEVSEALVDTKCDPAIEALLKNEGAKISDQSYLQLLADYKDSASIMGFLVERGNLPLSIATKMVSVVSENVSKELKIKHPNTVSRLNRDGTTFRAFEETINDSRENAVLSFLSDTTREKEAAELVQHLKDTKSLTPSIVLRALCKGDLSFFEHGIAQLSGVTLANTRRLLLDKRGFASLYKKAGLPQSMFESAKLVLDFACDEAIRGTIGDEGYASRIIDRIVDGGHDEVLTNMRYLMVLINSQASPGSSACE